MKQCTCYALRAVDCTCKPAKYGELYTSPTAKQEHGEPVAKVKRNLSGQIYIEWRDGEFAIANLVEANLYTTPQPNVTTSDMKQEHVDKTAKQRHEWVGLTDDEITALKRNGERYISSQDFARAVEAKLKEKNI
jgi:hypothetical protein